MAEVLIDQTTGDMVHSETGQLMQPGHTIDDRGDVISGVTQHSAITRVPLVGEFVVVVATSGAKAAAVITNVFGDEPHAPCHMQVTTRAMLVGPDGSVSIVGNTDPELSSSELTRTREYCSQGHSGETEPGCWHYPAEGEVQSVEVLNDSVTPASKYQLPILVERVATGVAVVVSPATQEGG